MSSPTLKAHDHHAFARLRGRIDVFDAGDFPQKLFHGPRGSLLDLPGAESRHGYHHIDHRAL